MIFKQFLAMFKARTMEFVRDRGSFYWSMLFPAFLVFAFAFAFSGQGSYLYKVGYVGQTDPAVSFMDIAQIQFISYDRAVDSIEKISGLLSRHQLDMLIDFDERSISVNSQSDKSLLLEKLFTAGEADFTVKAVSGKGVRYVDWFVPGVIGMNIMFSCLSGVGFIIVRYRKNGVLKRLKATPIGAFNFLSAQAASRLAIVLFTSVLIYGGTNFFLHFVMLGSYFNLLLVLIAGSLCMISLGLVFASRINNEELAGGVLNLVTFPMLAFSGVFYSLEGSPAILRTIGKFFPLTHVTGAARKIMLDGAGFSGIMGELAILGGLTVFFLILASLLFRWD